MSCDADCLLTPTLNHPPMHCQTWKGKAGNRDSQEGLETVQTPTKGRRALPVSDTSESVGSREERREREMLCKKEATWINHLSLCLFFLKQWLYFVFVKAMFTPP